MLNEDKHLVDILARGLEEETPMESAALVGKHEVANYLSSHQKKAEHWRNRNCLFKLWLNRKVGAQDKASQ